MKRAKFTKEQIVAVLKEHEVGQRQPTRLARGISGVTIYNRKASSGPGRLRAQRLKELGRRTPR
jgi:hypothetical protein